MWDKLRFLWLKQQRAKKKEKIKAIIEVLAYLLALCLFIGWCIALKDLYI